MIDGLLVSQGEAPLTRSMPRALAMVVASAMELVATLARLQREPPLTRWVVRELTTSHWFDISAARRELGYVPQRRIDEGLQEMTIRREGS